MPELPELEVIAEILTGHLRGEAITGAKVHNHLVVYSPIAELEAELIEKKVSGFRADGKFIIMDADHVHLVINPMLTGRFALLSRKKTPVSTDALSLEFRTHELWYSDQKRMGRVYFLRHEDYSGVAGFLGRGPSALDPSFTLDDFKARIRRHRGQIKNVLCNQRFVKGIGNAYADEILLYAGVLPFRTRESLSMQETERVYDAMTKTMPRYVQILRKRRLDQIGSDKRDFLMVHGKGGAICPLCGGRISEITANRVKTGFCQTCQR
jgi:formamidopyrimidine-DNA glycosylase